LILYVQVARLTLHSLYANAYLLDYAQLDLELIRRMLLDTKVVQTMRIFIL
jgi:hypothetical protein